MNTTVQSFFRRRRVGQADPVVPPVVVVIDIDNELSNWLAMTLSIDVYPEAIPEGTTDYPVLVYTIVDGDPYIRLSGPDGLAWLRYQFDFYSNLKSDVGQMTERLRLTIQGYAGPMGLASIRNVTLHRPASGFDRAGTGEDNYGMYRRMSEYTIYFDQTVPSR